MKKETNVILQILKSLIKGLASLVFHLVKMVYLIIQLFDTTVGKLFMKLPRLVRVIIIYSLIALSVFAILVLTKNINIKVNF